MAKGQVSEEELAKGLKGIGNFGGLTQPRVRRDNPFRDSRTETVQPEPVKTIELPVAQPEKQALKEQTPRAPRVAPKSVAKIAPPKPSAESRGRAKNADTASGRKADIFTERVTVQMSPEMRDEVERLARELQRARTSKEERITSNTVIRAAIVLVTKHFTLKAGSAPNTEDELYELIEATLAGANSLGRPPA